MQERAAVRPDLGIADHEDELITLAAHPLPGARGDAARFEPRARFAKHSRPRRSVERSPMADQRKALVTVSTRGQRGAGVGEGGGGLCG